MDKAFRIETGMYKPKWITKTRKKMLENATGFVYGTEGDSGPVEGVNILPDRKLPDLGPRYDKRKRRSNYEETRKRALLSLSNL